MKRFDDLYQELLKATIDARDEEYINALDDFDTHQLDCLLHNLIKGNTSANFYEGMGCKGGCVGGPKVIIPTEEGIRNVEEYGRLATYPTPIDNPYVIELLNRLGFESIESLLNDSDIFTRSFSTNKHISSGS